MHSKSIFKSVAWTLYDFVFSNFYILENVEILFWIYRKAKE